MGVDRRKFFTLGAAAAAGALLTELQNYIAQGH